MRMKKIMPADFLFPSIFLWLFCTNAANAQTNTDLLKIYDTATIHSIGKFYIKGSSRINFGNLKNEFTSPITMAYYKNAKADRIWGGLLTVTGATALVAGILVRKNSAVAANILSGAAIALNLGSLHFSRRSAELTDRAIWVRNREILFGLR